MKSRKLDFALLCGLVGLVAAATLTGCGGDDDGGDGDDDPIDAAAAPDTAVPPDAADVPPDAPAPDASTQARISVTVEYAGSSTGSLIVAAFPSFPPSGPPAAFAQDATPEWPQAVALEGLDPGTMYAFAVLDAPPSSPTQPGPEDRTVVSAALTLAAGETTEVTLTLTDPPSE